MPLRKLMSGVFFAILSAAPMFAAGPTVNPNTDFTVTLSKPGIDSKTAQKGDEIRAVVSKPDEFAGYEIVGKVNDAKSSGKVKGSSVMTFTFERLEKGTEQIPISGTLKQVTNSKAAPDVDEEGHAIRKKNNTGKVAAGAAVGALIGGLRGGAKGALVGAAIGGAASVVAVEIAAESGADFKLDPGSVMLITVSPQRAKQEEDQKPAAAASFAAPATYTAQMQKYTGAKSFIVRHDHGSTAENDGKYCEGVLYVFADRAKYEVASAGDGRSDPFDSTFADFKEIKSNFMPIKGHNAFHIKLTNGTSLNFTAPSNEVNEVLAAFPAPPRK